MDDCIFCKIVKGEIPSYKIYEDKDYLAFLDIFPPTEGYTLVVPKKHYRWVWDVKDIGGYFKVCQKIAKHFQKVSGVDGVYTIILGEEVPHAHVRIFAGHDKKFSNNLFKKMQELQSGEVIDPKIAKKIVRKFALKS